MQPSSNIVARIGGAAAALGAMAALLARVKVELVRTQRKPGNRPIPRSGDYDSRGGASSLGPRGTLD